MYDPAAPSFVGFSTKMTAGSACVDKRFSLQESIKGKPLTRISGWQKTIAIGTAAFSRAVGRAARVKKFQHPLNGQLVQSAFRAAASPAFARRPALFVNIDEDSHFFCILLPNFLQNTLVKIREIREKHRRFGSVCYNFM